MIYPDSSLEQFAELKKVELGEDNSHFNLVFNKNSALACLGSLSFDLISIHATWKIKGPKKGPKNVDKNHCEPIEDNRNVDKLKTVQRELLKCQSKNSVEIEYYKCEKELKI